MKVSHRSIWKNNSKLYKQTIFIKLLHNNVLVRSRSDVQGEFDDLRFLAKSLINDLDRGQGVDLASEPAGLPLPQSGARPVTQLSQPVRGPDVFLVVVDV